MAGPVPEHVSARQHWFASYGWILALALLLALAVPMASFFLVQRGRPRLAGDGRNVTSYGFDLANLKGDRAWLAAGNMPRDYLPALVEPAVIPGGSVEDVNAQLRRGHQGKFLVPTDRVVGVVLGGQARAYPIRVLNWHEIVNDTLAGAPIAVTYSGLCDSAVVFERRVGGRTLTLRHSGLVYNSNLVMFDVPPAGGAPSLWSQLLGRAIAGPAADAGESLTMLPLTVTTWEAWLARHPATTVLRGDAEYGKERYKTDPFGQYYDRGQPRFPVRANGGLAMPVGVTGPMDRIVAWREGEAWRTLAASAPEAAGAPVVVHTCWFAWAAALEAGR